MLNYSNLSQDDKRVKEIVEAINKILKNTKTVVEKIHETYGDVADGSEYIVWNNGVRVCRLAGFSLFCLNDNTVRLPGNVAKNLEAKFEKRCVKGEQIQSVELNNLLAYLGRFSR